jgi:hypothetical protein
VLRRFLLTAVPIPVLGHIQRPFGSPNGLQAVHDGNLAPETAYGSPANPAGSTGNPPEWRR